MAAAAAGAAQHPSLTEYKKREHQSLRSLVFDNRREVEAEHKANTLLAL